MASAALATAFSGLWVAIGAMELISFLDQSDTMNLAQAPPLDAAVQVMFPVSAIGAFDTAVTLIYVHLHNGRIPEVVTFILCASIFFLHLFLFLQPGAMDGAGQDPPLGAAVHVFLIAAATATFFLSITLIYVHARTVREAGAGAGNELTRAAVKLLTNITLAAALVTVILSLIAAILAFYTKIAGLQRLLRPCFGGGEERRSGGAALYAMVEAAMKAAGAGMEEGVTRLAK